MTYYTLVFSTIFAQFILNTKINRNKKMVRYAGDLCKELKYYANTFSCNENF